MIRARQIKRILFPVDFSDSSMGAAQYVEAMAGRFEAEVVMLHAVTMSEHNLAEELLPKRQVQLDGFLSDVQVLPHSAYMCNRRPGYSNCRNSAILESGSRHDGDPRAGLLPQASRRVGYRKNAA